MAEINLPSGAVAVINAAGWKEAKLLKMALERELAVTDVFSISAALLVDSSPIVDAALLPCLAKCLYNNQKIIESTFDKPETRADYYDIVLACVKENLGPLAVSLRSKLLEFGLLKTQEKPKDSQEPA